MTKPKTPNASVPTPTPVDGERIPLSTLAADPANPRTITSKALAGLSVSVETFGDLSGLVFNRRTGVMVGGHQRLRALTDAGATEFIRVSENAGYVEHPKTKERFSVRIVDWDETKQRLGNLTANNSHISGVFDERAIEQLRELEGVEGFDALALKDLEDELRKGAEKVAKDEEEAGKDETNKLKDGFMIIIDCEDEAHQLELLARFMEEDLKCRALT